ncbi:MAG: gliding motility-associated C-terminal domain-containing protein, partial [Bacteroidota bacterium]
QTGFGCDSVIITELDFINQVTATRFISICSDEDWEGSFYNNDTTLVEIFTGSNGCDSTLNTVLTIFTAYDDVQDQVAICEGDSILLGDNYETESGIYPVNFMTVDGCDSLVTYELTVHPSYSFYEEHQICQGDSIYLFGAYRYFTQRFTHNYTTVNGCDSIREVQLFVRPFIEVTETIQICPGDEIVIDGISYDSPTNFRDTFTSVFGCDSIHISDIVWVDEYRVDEAVLLCRGDGIFVGGAFQTNAGIYTDTLSSQAGCDSIIYTQVQFVDEFRDTLRVHVCDNEPYLGVVYTESTELVNTYTAAGGCDSVEVVVITVLPGYAFGFTEEICEGDSLLIGDQWQFESGTYIQYLESQRGCDSIVTTVLRVNPVYYDYDERSICEGDSIYLFGAWRNSTELFAFEYQTVQGCDSIYEFQLNVGPFIEVREEVQLCQGDDVMINGDIYSEPTTITNTYVSSFGCDSIHIHEIVWVERYNTEDVLYACIGQEVELGGGIQTEPGIYVDTLTSRAGCDSIVATTLIYIEEFRDTLRTTLCSNETYEGELFENDTTLVRNYTAVGGCDSIEVIHLRLLPAFDDTIYAAICESDSLLIGDTYQRQSGTFVQMLQTTEGCDSVVTTILEVHPEFYAYQEIQICDGDSIFLFGEYHYDSRLFTNTFQTVNGCDSIIDVQLRVTNTLETTVEVPICEGDGVWIDGTWYTEPTTISNTYVSSFGCDSIHIQNIVWVEQYETYVDADICEGETIFLGGALQDSPGFYIDTLQSQAGCDSIIYTSLSVRMHVSRSQRMDICEGETAFIAGALRDSEGTFVEYLESQYGCDSTVTTQLFVHKPNSIFTRDTICLGESIVIGGVERTLPGVYVDHFTNRWGCDSVVTVQLFTRSAYIAFSESHEICEGDSILLAGAWRFESGTYVDTTASNVACNRITYHTLTVNEIDKERFEQILICEGDSAFIANAWRFESGEWEDTVRTAADCGYRLLTELVVQPPAYPVGMDTVICLGESVQLFVDGNIGADISWTGALTLSCDDCPDPIATPFSTTEYVATYSDVCTDEPIRLVFRVEVVRPVVLDVSADTEVVRGDSVTLVATSSDPDVPTIWTNSAGDVLCRGCSTLTVAPTTATTIYVSAINDAGCGSSDLININVNAGCEHGELEVANIIVPNSGGYGSELEIDYDNVEINLLRIYNRWGEMVYETNDITKKWDGTFRGQPLNPGVYVYYIVGVCLDEEVFIKVGNVTLIN